MANVKSKKGKKSKKLVSRTKSDIASAVMLNAKRGDVASYAQAKRIVDNVFDAIVNFTESGHDVRIRRFGTFSRVTRKARAYTTPDGRVTEVKNLDKLVFKSSPMITVRFNAISDMSLLSDLSLDADSDED